MVGRFHVPNTFPTFLQTECYFWTVEWVMTITTRRNLHYNGQACSSQANSPQPSRVLSTANASTPTAYSSHILPAYWNAPWPVRQSHPAGQWGAPERSSRLAASCKDTRRAFRLNMHATTQHHSQRCNFPIHFPYSLNPSLASVRFWFGGIETWLGGVREQSDLESS